MAGTPNYGMPSNDWSRTNAGTPPMTSGRTTSEETYTPTPFSHKAPTLATDMRCYFACQETFKKDYDLRLHLKIKHKNEDQNELKIAYQAAEEEIALTRKSYSTFQCALCPKQLQESGAFSGHIRKSHQIQWLDYKNKYGRCEIESAPFECKICGRVVKYGSHTVHVHLKNCHNITWVQYLDRIRKMRRGEAAEELPALEFFECKVCTAQVKFMFRGKHLKGVHKITEAEYVELFKEELQNQMVDNQQRRLPSTEIGSVGMKLNPMESRNKSLNDRMASNEYEVDVKPHQVQNQRMQQLPINTGFNSPFHTSANGAVRLPNQPIPLPKQPFQSEISNMKPPKSDIQEKTNKKCSSCMITFDSRRNFIEHCTSFHGMKFKTLSGVTIAAGTMSMPNTKEAQLGIKRKSEDNEGMLSNRSKYSNQAVNHQMARNGGFPRNGTSIESGNGYSEEDDEDEYNVSKTLPIKQQYANNNEKERISPLPLF